MSDVVGYEVDPGVKELIDEVTPGWLDADQRIVQLVGQMLDLGEDENFGALIEEVRNVCAKRDGVEPDKVTDEILAKTIGNATWFICDRESYDAHYITIAYWLGDITYTN